MSTCLSLISAGLDELAGHDTAAWEREHRQFHRSLIRRSDLRLLAMIEQFHDRSERYRSAYNSGEPRAWSYGAADHRDIVDACAARDARAAAALLARHLSRTALTVLLMMAPEHDPVLVRAAVRQFTNDAPPCSATRPRTAGSRAAEASSSPGQGAAPSV